MTFTCLRCPYVTTLWGMLQIASPHKCVTLQPAKIKLMYDPQVLMCG